VSLAKPELRLLEPADDARYRELWIKAMTQHAECFRTSLDDAVTHGIPTRHTADSFTVGAFVGEQLVGITSLDREARLKLRHKAHLYRMFVDPQARAHGVGGTLMRETITRAAAIDGLRQIWLTVLETNQAAQRLYAAAGFRGYASEPEAVRIGDRYVAEQQMVRFLRRENRAISPD
jgi:ribosomal protein S18 acetylase RimI-like enzyme